MCEQKYKRRFLIRHQCPVWELRNITISLTRNSFQDSVFLMLNLVFFHRRVAENRRILSYDHLNTRGQTWWSKRLFCNFYALSPLEISIKFDMKTSTNISLCSSFIYMYILHFPVCQSCFFMSCALCNTFFFRIKGNLQDIHLVKNLVQNKLSIRSSHKMDWSWFH